VFYSTVALASVTLAGLLFVSLSIHRELIQGRQDAILLRLARGSFGDFLYVLMLGLVFLVPHQVPIGLATALFVLGAARAAGLVRQLVLSARTETPGRNLAHGLREVALLGLASLGLLVVAIEVLRGAMVAIYGWSSSWLPCSPRRAGTPG
jgi:hypothetical protein